MTSIEFIQDFIIRQAKELQQKKHFLASTTVLIIGLEIMGGFFDKKPLKSPKQSKYRFRLATDKLLKGKYAIANQNDYLYETLRNQLLHSLIPGQGIKFIEGHENHLLEKEKILCFNPEQFLIDVEAGTDLLKKLIQEGKAFEKRIPDNSHDLLKWI